VQRSGAQRSGAERSGVERVKRVKRGGAGWMKWWSGVERSRSVRGCAARLHNPLRLRSVEGSERFPSL